jgi:riboflavin kinase/FMN adenylyltransferase
MKQFSRLTDLKGQFSQTAVALGTFDGIHIGHQKIINQAVQLGRSLGLASVVFTFANHPLSRIDPRRCPPQIITVEYKAQLIAALGVDILLSLPFTSKFLHLSPEAFIELLLTYLRPAQVVVGPNYSFGYRGAGTPQMLERAGQQHGFAVNILPAVYKEDILVSSTAIRQLIQAGDVVPAAALLGRPVRISGPVAAGHRRGHILGYPTANLAIEPALVTPGDGVYAVCVAQGDQKFRGLANIGDNPTFADGRRRIEVHILGFTGDIYGQTIGVDFLGKLRGERKFCDAKALQAQIAQDIRDAQKYYC